MLGQSLTDFFLRFSHLTYIFSCQKPVYRPDNFESYNSLKLSLTNIWNLCSIFVDCECFLEWNSPDILALCKANLDDSIGSGNFSEGLLCFNLKGFYCSYVRSCSFCEGKTSFCTGLVSRKLCRLLIVFSTGFTSLSVLLLFPLSIAFFIIFMHDFLFYFI